MFSYSDSVREEGRQAGAIEGYAAYVFALHKKGSSLVKAAGLVNVPDALQMDVLGNVIAELIKCNRKQGEAESNNEESQAGVSALDAGPAEFFQQRTTVFDEKDMEERLSVLEEYGFSRDSEVAKNVVIMHQCRPAIFEEGRCLGWVDACVTFIQSLMEKGYSLSEALGTIEVPENIRKDVLASLE